METEILTINYTNIIRRKQDPPLIIANETLIGTLMKTETLTENYTINYTEKTRSSVNYR